MESVRRSLDGIETRKSLTCKDARAVVDQAIKQFSEIRSNQENEMQNFVKSESSRIEKEAINTHKPRTRTQPHACCLLFAVCRVIY